MPDTDFSIDTLIEHEDSFEDGAIKEAVVRYYKDLAKAERGEKDMLLFTPEMKLLMKHVPPLEKMIVDNLTKAGGRSSKLLREAFGDIRPVELAVLTIRHCFNHYMGDQTMQTICIKLADDVRVHKDDQRFARDFKAYRAVVMRSIKTDHPGHKHKVLTHARKKMFKTKSMSDTVWNKREKLLIGKTLIDFFMETGGLFYKDEFLKPHKLYVKKLGRKVSLKGVTLKPTEWTTKWLERNHEFCSILVPILKPMVVPPVDWVNPWKGGYVSQKFAKGYRSCRLIRNVDQEWLRQNASRIQPEVYEALNSLQRTPYHINSRVVEILDELKMSGQAGLPDGKLPKMVLPTKPWEQQSALTFEEFDEKYPDAVKAWKIAAHKKYQTYWNEKSKRTRLLEEIRIAKMFIKYPSIYFPVNLDWRGRTFCMSTPVFTPQGDDPAKGCIEYAEGKRIVGPAVKEFEIHGANVYGKDKLSENDRIEWVRSHAGMIQLVDSIPYGEASMEFWSNADKPFQFLAFCFDYAAWLRDPKHKSHLICQIDQTCSGLQHWSAVLHDGKGGAQVGMIDKSMPDDVYQAVATEVESRLEHDTDPMAIAWQGKVSRTITKRNVMTKLYGATMPGMRDQVIKELNDLDKKCKTDSLHPEYASRYLEGAPEDNYKMAQYIARKNDEAMREIVKKADEGMKYVQACAKALAEQGKSVKWVSPIGVPIEQTYWQTRTQRVKTYWISVDINKESYRYLVENRRGTEVKLNLSHEAPERGVQVKKAEQSIAPNYIHSMDASHLLFIALGWKDHGGCLTTVHDSFGTHAADLPDLHKVVREQFVMMYEEKDFLYKFLCDISTDCVETTEIERPTLGSINFNDILTSTYFCR